MCLCKKGHKSCTMFTCMCPFCTGALVRLWRVKSKRKKKGHYFNFRYFMCDLDEFSMSFSTFLSDFLKFWLRPKQYIDHDGLWSIERLIIWDLIEIDRVWLIIWSISLVKTSFFQISAINYPHLSDGTYLISVCV